MILSNLHTHTKFSDGKHTPEEIVKAAIRRGLRSIGFSEHGYVWFEKGGCMSPQQMLEYTHTINALKGDYAGVIDIYRGLENDIAQLHSSRAFDYTIGAVHYARAGNTYYAVDHSAEGVAQAVQEGFGGDGMAFVRSYYTEVKRLAENRSESICAHLDLVRRFNEGGRFFDENSAAYRVLALDALEAVVKSGMLLEVNTASIAKGFSDEPYPAIFLLQRARELGARIIVGADAHDARYLTYGFPEMEELLRDIGFTETWELTGKGFVPVPLPEIQIAEPQPLVEEAIPEAEE